MRGVAAYRAMSWDFFGWQLSGAVFDIVALDVMAGDDVACAYVLLRCAKWEEMAQHSERRLRATLGLRDEGGRWVVSHARRSFPLQAREHAENRIGQSLV